MIFAACSTPNPPKDCVLTLTPSSLSIAQDATGSFNANLDRVCGFTGSGSLRVDDAASYPMTVSFDPASSNGSASQGTVKVNSAAALGNYTLTVRAIGDNGQSRSANLVVTVTAKTAAVTVRIDPKINANFVRASGVVGAQASLSEAAMPAMEYQGKVAQFSPAQVVVKLKPGKNNKDLEQLLKKFGGKLLDDGKIPAPPANIPKSELRKVEDSGFRLVSVIADTVDLSKMADRLARKGLKGEVKFSNMAAAALVDGGFALVDEKDSAVIGMEMNWVGSSTSAPISGPVYYDHTYNSTYLQSDEDDALLNLNVSQLNGAWAHTFSDPSRWITNQYIDGRGVQIAIIDSGFDPSNYDFTGYNPESDKYSYNRSISQYDFRDNDYNTYDPDCTYSSCWHGISVAGAAAGSANNLYGIAGVAPRSDLFLFRASGYFCLLWCPGAFIDYYKAGKAVELATSWGADVVNMSFRYGDFCSLGSSTNCYLYNMSNNAVNNGVILVASAGNEGNTIYQYPAAYSSVIAVGGYDHYLKRFSWSSYGDWVRLWAPGVGRRAPIPSDACYSTKKCSTTSHNFSFSGTSFAAPLVAGVIALLKQVKPSITSTQACALLQVSSRVSPDADVRYPINAALALEGLGATIPMSSP
jgi:hypothetical protein